jgi:hypothetical protein
MTMVLVGTGVFASPAHADRLDAKERKARIECSAGNSAEGVRLLAELWVATGDATWLYNQGRCYEQSGQNDLAASRFREYLRKAEKLPPEDLESVNRRIEELDRRAAGRSAPAPAVITLVQPPPVPPVPASAPTATTPDRTAELASLPPSSSTADSPFYTRWWFWTGVGAAVVAGVVAAVLLSRGGNESPSCDPGVPCVP